MASTLQLTTLLQLLLFANEARAFKETKQKSADCRPCVCNLTDLTADCSQRNLSVVPEHLPKDIKSLNMERNMLCRLTAKNFARYRKMANLNLEGNQLELNSHVYDQDAFIGLDNLLVLNIGNNCDTSSRHSYPGVALSKLVSLTELVIDGIPRKAFDTSFKILTKLRNVTFGGYCNLDCIPKDMFKNTPYLRFLNMSSCQISDVPLTIFSPLSSIDTIDISNNIELTLQKGIASTYGLQRSSIRVLHMDAIVKPFSACVIIKKDPFRYLVKTNITELHANHNWIETMAGGLTNYPRSLKKLSLRDNRFIGGNIIFGGVMMKGLKTIDLSDMAVPHHIPSKTSQNNRVFQGPPDLANIIARKYLLGGHIPEIFYNISRIKYLDISQNAITEWIGPVHFFTTLTHADFSSCFCSKIALTFFPSFPKLIFLNVSYNLIGDALSVNGSIFQNLTSLEILDLSTNRIRKLNRYVFIANTKLRYLNISDNELTQLSFDVTQLTNLLYLDLAINGLITIHQSARMSLGEISKNLSLDLSGNSFQCTCDQIDFLIWFSTVKINFKNNESYHCSDGHSENLTMNIQLILSFEIKCKSVFGIITAGIVGIVLFLAIAVMGLVYRYRWKIKYLYYVARDRYRLPGRHGSEERYYDFDAFVSCSDEDLSFAETLLNHLEGQGRRVCVHHRDFRPGEPIASNIVRAVQMSRRTLIILSRHFLSSTWCRYEFEMAKMEAVHAGRNVILVVKIGDIDSADIPRELMYMMKTDSYAEFPESVDDQPSFWVTLNSALSSHS